MGDALRTLQLLVGLSAATACTPSGPFLGPIQDIEVKAYGSNDPTASYCSSFRPSPTDMVQRFRRVVVVTMRQIHDNFDVGPCFVNGTATFGHSQVAWEWFIGGTGRVTFVDAGDIHLIADPTERSPIED